MRVMWRNLSLPVTIYISFSFSFSLCPIQGQSLDHARIENATRVTVSTQFVRKVCHRVAHKRRPSDSSLQRDVPTREGEIPFRSFTILFPFTFSSCLPFGTSGLDTLASITSVFQHYSNVFVGNVEGF